MVFEYIVTVPPGEVDFPKLIESTNAILSQLKADPSAQEKQAEIILGNYTNLTWNNRQPFQNRTDVTNWGVKTLPGAGAFYFANYEDDTMVLKHVPGSAPGIEPQNNTPGE